MKEFISSALKRISRMNEEQLRDLLQVVFDEYALFSAMMDSVYSGLILMNHDNEIVKTNRAAERILSTPLSDFSGKKAWDCFGCEKIAEFIQTVIKNEEGKKSEVFVLNNQKTNFENKYVHVSILPLVSEKKIIGTIVILEDITKKKKYEIQKHRLESLASLTNVAATVAHEIKNPLGAMSIHAQLLRKNIKKNNLSNKVIKNHLDIIEEEIERLNNIVVDFLFAVRPLKFRFANVNINSVLENLIALYKSDFEKANILIKLTTNENIKQIWGDERFLRQAFINIITNAKAAMPKGGTLSIITDEKNDMVIITFTDTGVGIKQENLHKIFEPYFTTKADGTGLGLTMTYKVVKEHGGDVYVHSTEGRGTYFVLSLPILKNHDKLLIESDILPKTEYSFLNNKDEINKKGMKDEI